MECILELHIYAYTVLQNHLGVTCIPIKWSLCIIVSCVKWPTSHHITPRAASKHSRARRGSRQLQPAATSSETSKLNPRYGMVAPIMFHPLELWLWCKHIISFLSFLAISNKSRNVPAFELFGLSSWGLVVFSGGGRFLWVERFSLWNRDFVNCPSKCCSVVTWGDTKIHQKHINPTHLKDFGKVTSIVSLLRFLRSLLQHLAGLINKLWGLITCQPQKLAPKYKSQLRFC